MDREDKKGRGDKKPNGKPEKSNEFDNDKKSRRTSTSSVHLAPESFRTKQYGPKVIVQKVKVAPIPEDVVNARQAAERRLAGNTFVPANDVLDILETLPPEALQSLQLATARKRKPRPKPMPKQSVTLPTGGSSRPLVTKPSPEGGDARPKPMPKQSVTLPTGSSRPLVTKPSPEGGDARPKPMPKQSVTLPTGGSSRPLVTKPSPEGGDAGGDLPETDEIKMDRGPVASKVIYLPVPEPVVVEPKPEPKPEPEPEVPPEEEEEPVEEKEPGRRDSLPLFVFDDDNDHLLEYTEQDRKADKKLKALIKEHQEARKRGKPEKKDLPKFTTEDLINSLLDIGIPIPTDEDYGILESNENRWDPVGTVLEYFSPVMRSFIPVNMRGRYRGTWPSDTCIKGLDISNVPPKHDALEGFVDRGIHESIQEQYDEFSEIASDEAHLDYLVEMAAIQAETLPIPIFYDMLHLGIQVANETLELLVQDQGYPPNNPIFRSQLRHAEQLRRKVILYGALGLETIDSKTRGFGKYLTQWVKTRDEILMDIMYWKDINRQEKLMKERTIAAEMEATRREHKIAKRMTKAKSLGLLQTLKTKQVVQTKKAEAPNVPKGKIRK